MAGGQVTYSVKEIYLTLQGEGAQAGRAAVFCRFAGCNLWNGLERDRDRAECRFCDTDFVGTDGPGGGKFKTADDLADAIAKEWPASGSLAASGPRARRGPRPYVIFTGGEPMLQLDDALIAALKARGFEVGVETNGTLHAPDGIDWICMSPKADTDIVIKAGQELKLIWPQAGSDPKDYEDFAFDHWFLQPMDEGNEKKNAENVKAATDYCLTHPRWRLSVQTHKVIGLP